MQTCIWKQEESQEAGKVFWFRYALDKKENHSVRLEVQRVYDIKVINH